MITLTKRLLRLQARLASQRLVIGSLHADNHQLRTTVDQLTVEVEQLRQIVTASPEEAQRLWVAYHDRCEQLTRANHALRCTDCSRRVGPFYSDTTRRQAS